MLGITVV